MSLENFHTPCCDPALTSQPPLCWSPVVSFISQPMSAPVPTPSRGLLFSKVLVTCPSSALTNQPYVQGQPICLH